MHRKGMQRRFPLLDSRIGVVMRVALLPLVVIALLGGYWLLPINGQVLILTDPQQTHLGAWPQTWVEPPAARPGETVTLYVRDNAPWAHIKLLIEGEEVARDEGFNPDPNNGPWTWRWVFQAPNVPNYEAVFYHDCHTGCVERARIALGPFAEPGTPGDPPRPTKLGVVFADPARDWRGRAAWTVELTYAERPYDTDFSIDGLARWVHAANRNGLRVLVRVAYDQRQALPPVGDELALARFLEYCEQLARDDRLNGVYAFVIGSGYNGLDENQLFPDQPTTPEWYARVLNGYGLAPGRDDNVVQRMRGVDPSVRILVGPPTPWNTDQDGSIPDPLDQPWLNYMNTVTAYIDRSTQTKGAAGWVFAAPDGFALQAPGRPEAPEVREAPASEPRTDLRRPEWGEAQAGFRVYQDWLRIINRYDTTRGLPAYIVSTNTWTEDTQIQPAQNYPAGWLTNALAEINREPQVRALCWFVDSPMGEIWSGFSLSRRTGRMFDAAEEFDRLLQ